MNHTQIGLLLTHEVLYSPIKTLRFRYLSLSIDQQCPAANACDIHIDKRLHNVPDKILMKLRIYICEQEYLMI
jgi:hypothetical protein